jgi:choline kinase
LNIVFVAAGLNTRFEELSIFPKMLLPVGKKSILKNNIDVLGDEHNYYIIANKKFKNIYDSYLKINKINIKILYTSNSNGSYNSISSVYKKLPKHNILFIWSDLFFTKRVKFDVHEEYYILFTHKGKYSYKVKDREIVKDNNGNIPGIYYFASTKKIFKKKKEQIDLINIFSDLHFNVKEINGIVELKDKEKYLSYTKNINYKEDSCRFFNKIHFLDNAVIKECINNNYLNLLKNEIEWYKKVPNEFHPKFGEYQKDLGNKYIMENLSSWKSLKDYYEEDKSILKTVISKVNLFHELESILVSKKNVFKDFKIEFYSKVLKRLSNVKGILISYNKNEIKKILKNALKYLLNEINTNKYYLIHGDLNGSNILVSKNRDIKFIDPRGYFGKTKLYGPKEYDLAKLSYFLHGYDYLNDNRFIYEENNFPPKIGNNLILEQKKYKVLVGIIYLSLTEWIANDIMKVNIAYNYGRKLLYENSDIQCLV